MEINTKFFRKIPVFFISIYLSLSLIVPPAALAQIQDVVESKDANNVYLYAGDLVTVKVNSLTRIAVANPGIVDVTNATAEEITLIGRKVGETQIFIWEEGVKRQIVARVLGADLARIANRLASLVQSSGIGGVTLEKNYDEGKIIVSGYVSKSEKKKLDDILKNFTDVVLNMVIEEGDLIQIDVQFSELDTTLSKALGFDWTEAFDIEETLPTQDGSFTDLFKLGDFSRTTAIVSVVNLLIQEGRGRILSKPSLVVTNGQEASFLVGGEIPIRTTTTSVGGGSTQENVEFKDYGVELKVTPEIIDGKIDIKINVSVRDLDSSNAVGDDVAFLTRTANTNVRLFDNQTIVLAGMIQRRQAQTTKRVPFVSKVPVVGLLFQNKSNSTPDTDQELVVSLTPRILREASRVPPEVIKANKEKEKAEAQAKLKAEQEAKEKAEQEAKKKAMPPAETLTTGSESKAPSSTMMETPVPDSVSKAAVKKTPMTKAEKKAAAAKAKAEKKAAAAKARADKKAAAQKRKADALKAKQEKIAKAKLQKEEREKARKEARDKKKQKSIPTKPTKSEKKAKTAKATKPAQKSATPNVNQSTQAKDSGDPSLNMALDDPRLTDPQNELSEEEINSIKEKYAMKIKSEMADTISYPYEAKASGWEGTAVLNITLSPDGNVRDVSVTESSGYAVFDKDAVNTAQILSPYDSFIPAKNMREITVSVPVEYSEKAILGEPSR